MKASALSKIEEGRRLLGLDMVVRTASGEAATESNTLLLKLYRLHRDTLISKDTKPDKKSNLDYTKSTMSKLRGSMILSHITMNQGHETPKPPPRHLLVNLKSFGFTIGENTELTLFLYQESKKELISETFTIFLDGLGNPTDKSQSTQTLFRDIPSMIALSDIWLVCKIVKINGDSNKDSSPVRSTKEQRDEIPNVRRPFAMSITNVGSAGIKRDKEVEYTSSIFHSTKDENQYSFLFDLIKSSAKDIEELPKSSGLVYGLNMMVGKFNELNLKSDQIDDTLISYPMTCDESDDYYRNDIYVTIKSGVFSTSTPVELSCELRDSNGVLVPDCISIGSYDRKLLSTYKSLVFNRTSMPFWNETFCIKIAPQILSPGMHVCILVRSLGNDKKEKGISVAKLELVVSDLGTLTRSSEFSLPLIKPSKGVDPKKDHTWYLKPAPKVEKKGTSKTSEFIKARVLVVSNQVTQSEYLHSLFNWRKLGEDTLKEVLGKITFAGDEITKFVNNTFNALFEIIESKNANICHTAFVALINAIEMLTDERKQRSNYRHLLDVYIENCCKATSLHEDLLTILVEYFGSYDKMSSTDLITTIRSLEYLLKFIIQSKTMNSNETSDSQNFKAKLLKFFDHINTLLRNQNRQYVGLQTTIVKKLAPLFDLLLKIFTPLELSNIVSNILNSISSDASTRFLIFEKLSLIQTMVSIDLFKFRESREILMPIVMYQLKSHLNLSLDEATHVCILILHQMMDNMQADDQSYYIEFMVPMLPTIVKLVELEEGNDDMVRYDLVMALLGMYYFMGPDQFGDLLKSQPDQGKQKHILNDTCNVLLRFITRKVVPFPENWFVMLMFMYSTVLKLIIILASYMKDRTSILDQEIDLWSNFFRLILACVNSKVLELEAFAESKRYLILERYGDMRMELMQILQHMWDFLENHQFKFIGQLVSPFFQLVVLEQPVISETGINLYLSLIMREYQMTGSFKRTESLTIEMMDSVFHTLLERAKQISTNDDERREYVMTWLDKKIGSRFDPKDHLGAQAIVFLKEMSHFLQLLYDLRGIPDDAEWIDERTIGTIRLMEYLLSTGRVDPYKKYVHGLVNQHIELNNYVEAGNILMLHADLLSWSTDSYDEPHGEFPRQTHRERKIALYRKAIEYFDKAKMWEICVQLTNELRVIYERQIYDFDALTQLMTDLSTFYSNIAGSERFFCEYFRVGYYGKGFSVLLRNREFIFRGLELERLADFTQRIQSKFPQAQLLNYTEEPQTDVQNSEGQFLQIFSVRPTSIEEYFNKSHPKIRDEMATLVQKYYIYNEVNLFVYSKPFRKNKRSGETQVEEFADLWINNTYYITQEKFPTMYKRSEVIKKLTKETTPLENAIVQIHEKNLEIRRITLVHSSLDASSSSHFTMVLKGVIDAAVNGGTKLYIDAFLSQQYISSNPTHLNSCKKLQQLIREQEQLLENGLNIHRKLCSMDMLGLQEQLEVQMAQVQAENRNREAALSAIFAQGFIQVPNKSPEEISTGFESNNLEVKWMRQGKDLARAKCAKQLLIRGMKPETISIVTSLTLAQIHLLK